MLSRAGKIQGVLHGHSFRSKNSCTQSEYSHARPAAAPERRTCTHCCKQVFFYKFALGITPVLHFIMMYILLLRRKHLLKDIFDHLLVSYRRGRKDKRQEKEQGERQGNSDRVPPGKDLPTGKRQLSDTEGMPSIPYFLSLCLGRPLKVCGARRLSIQRFASDALGGVLVRLVCLV